MNGDFLRRLSSGPPLILDSAMGTELERRGMELDLPLWSARALLDNPDLVLEIHRDNAAAGADVLTANTFRTQRGTLQSAGLADRAAELTRLAVSLARRAADESGRDVLVAGSVSPLADCYRPDLVPERSVLEREHAAHAENLLSAGVDLLLLETMNTIREAQAAAGAAGGAAGKAARNVPVVVSFVTDGEGALLSGEPLAEAARCLLPSGPAAVGVNCISSANIGRELERLAASAPGTPLAAYANNLSDGDSPDRYASRASAWVRAGALLVGGCCGTTPHHVAALASLVSPERSALPR